MHPMRRNHARAEDCKDQEQEDGRISVYESVSHYDPEKKASRPIRTYLGQEDPVTGELIPSSGRRGRPKKGEARTNAQSEQNPLPTQQPQEGATDVAQLLERIAVLEARVKELEGLLAARESLLDIITGIVDE